MPPVFDSTKSKVDGLAFLGLSLSRYSENGHPDSVTNQTAFDLNEVIDRDYKYISATNDDGWLVGGGEPGVPKSYKLAATDSAHVELMRIGTYNTEWGGLDRENILDTLKEGKIMIPQIKALPSAVVANPDTPPELEVRFDMDPKELEDFLVNPESAKLPTNWALRFIHNQLFKHFEFPSRFCPGPFHSTIARKAEFRSQEHREGYFKTCAKVIQKWKEAGPQALQPPESGACSFGSGIYLFTDRNNISHKFEPNFLPPYDTADKRMIIAAVLEEEWEEKTLAWKPISTWKSRQCGGSESKYITCNVM